jgi:hypothetical protein
VEAGWGCTFITEASSARNENKAPDSRENSPSPFIVCSTLALRMTGMTIKICASTVNGIAI